MPPFFPILILNARPGAGKSEIIHALHGLGEAERIQRFHIGPMHVLDDFPMLWTWFEEDEILEREFGRPRLHTTRDGYFIHEDMWHLLIRRLALEYAKWRRDAEGEATVIIEFSRGSQHGGYRAAYPYLGHEILRQAASLYIQVSFEESLRKNRLRFNPERPDSVLEHGLTDAKLRKLYEQDDWSEFTAGDPDYLEVEGIRLPYAVFDNEDDVTTQPGPALFSRLESTLDRLWTLRQQLEQA